MMKKTVTKEYNKDWQKKKLEPERIKSQERVYFAFSNLFNKVIKTPFKGTVLDVGCGDGALVELLNSKKNINAKGIDINQGIDFETDKLPFKENEFDFVVMYSVLEHLYNPGNILSEIKRVLKKNGFMIAIIPNYDPSRLISCNRKFYHDPTHVHPYNPVSLQHLMRLYNFEKCFLGLWTIKKSAILWKMPMNFQFFIGAITPFAGNKKTCPSFLKGKSKTMLCVFKNEK